jgi:hypothetical protein
LQAFRQAQAFKPQAVAPTAALPLSTMITLLNWIRAVISLLKNMGRFFFTPTNVFPPRSQKGANDKVVG